MNFESDNVTSVSPAIMDAIVAANAGSASSYGADAITKRLDELFSRLFETDVAVMPVVTGTAANALSLATFLPGYGAAYCHAHAHINAHEAGAPEFYSGGGRLVSIEGAHAKYDAAALGAALDEVPPDFVHMAKPAIVSLSQSTELGVVYSLDEVRGQHHGMFVDPTYLGPSGKDIDLAAPRARMKSLINKERVALGLAKRRPWPKARVLVRFRQMALRPRSLAHARACQISRPLRAAKSSISTGIKPALMPRVHPLESAKSPKTRASSFVMPRADSMSRSASAR